MDVLSWQPLKSFLMVLWSIHQKVSEKRGKSWEVNRNIFFRIFWKQWRISCGRENWRFFICTRLTSGNVQKKIWQNCSVSSILSEAIYVRKFLFNWQIGSSKAATLNILLWIRFSLIFSRTSPKSWSLKSSDSNYHLGTWKKRRLTKWYAKRWQLNNSCRGSKRSRNMRSRRRKSLWRKIRWTKMKKLKISEKLTFQTSQLSKGKKRCRLCCSFWST